MHRFLCALVLISSSALAAEPIPPKEPGTLLREGTWGGGVGSYCVPMTLDEAKPASWPIDGWYRLRLQSVTVQSERLATPDKGQPDFMRSIVTQLLNPEAEAAQAQGDAAPDFIIRIGGNNSGGEAVLLSSQARPGKNAATASLWATGC